MVMEVMASKKKSNEKEKLMSRKKRGGKIRRVKRKRRGEVLYPEEEREIKEY